MGFSVYAFASAQEFLSSPRLPETSCVIADVQMPGMSGVELQEYLIAHDHGLPVIFITAFAHERVRERAMKGGAVCFLSKRSTNLIARMCAAGAHAAPKPGWPAWHRKSHAGMRPGAGATKTRPPEAAKKEGTASETKERSTSSVEKKPKAKKAGKETKK